MKENKITVKKSLCTALVISLVIIACSTPKRAQVGDVLSFTDIETNVHSFGYYTQDEGSKDSAYINIKSDDDYSFQIRIAREELNRYNRLLDSCKYIDFDAKKNEPGKNTLRFIILPESIQASKKKQ